MNKYLTPIVSLTFGNEHFQQKKRFWKYKPLFYKRLHIFDSTPSIFDPLDKFVKTLRAVEILVLQNRLKQ